MWNVNVISRPSRVGRTVHVPYLVSVVEEETGQVLSAAPLTHLLCSCDLWSPAQPSRNINSNKHFVAQEWTNLF